MTSIGTESFSERRESNQIFGWAIFGCRFDWLEWRATNSQIGYLEQYRSIELAQIASD